jgi:PKD repeat protein
MNRLILIILAFIAFPVVAQPPLINRYEFWFNRQTDEKTVTDITPVLQANVQLNLSAAELPDGLNSFTIRFRDSENMWSPSLTRFFVKMPVVENDSDPRQIVACEYRFNHEEMTSQSLEASQVISFDELLSTHDLPSGLNSFSIRFKDNKGLWSAMLTRFFVKMPVVQDGGETGEIVAYEFGFNNGEMNYQTVTAAADISIDEVLNVAGLPYGLNSFSIRFKDNAGYWSSVLTRFFIKMPVPEYEGEENQLTTYQVWFNNDFSDVMQNSISGETAFNLIENLDTSDLPNGLNKVNVRFKDSNGRWSSVLSKFFVKNPVQESSGTNLMTAWEFWLEDDQGNTFNENGQPGRTLITLDEPIDPLLLDLNLDLRMIPHGDYFMMFRFLDTNGSWSSVLSKEVEKTIYPLAVFTASETIFCGEGTVSFSNFSIDADEYLWDFGDGNTSADAEPVHFYESPGIYTVSLSVTWSATGQSHSLMHEDLIEVLALPEPEILAGGPLEFCEGDSVVLSSSIAGEYLWSTGETTASVIVTESGDYWLQLTDMNQCTGVSETITVEVFELPDVVILLPDNEPWCEGEEVTIIGSPEGLFEWSTGDNSESIVVTQTGTYWLTVTDNNGCSNTDEAYVFFHPLPEAAFSFEADYLEVFFTNESQGAINYYWDFGDGNFSEDENPQHSFAQAGVYDVCLTAFTDAECEETICHTFELTTGIQHANYDFGGKVYPVPFDGFLIISLNRELSWQSLEVISSNSKRVYYFNPANDQSNFRLETSHWSPGIYLILATTHSGETFRLKAIRK